MLPALRRWFLRHPARWVLGLALGVALSGAQLVATCHEISHLLAQGGVAGVATLAPAGAKTSPATGIGGHECPLCLVAAALGGLATAPHGLLLPVAHGLAAAPRAVACVFVPRFAPAYASRDPPLASPAA